jgi:hypothetical protein
MLSRPENDIEKEDEILGGASTLTSEGGPPALPGWQ